MKELNSTIKAIQNGMMARGNGPRGGCGRAYVCLSSTADKATLNMFRRACEAAGLRYLGRAYGISSKRAAYVGYDNADGHALAQADAIALNLRALGFDVYSDGAGD